MTDAATIAAFTPPGQFMCCICFDFFPIEDAWKDEVGQAWGMCQKDGEENG
jgi:hypothetical protein